MTERKLTVETLEELLEFPALQKLDNWKRAARTALAALEKAKAYAAEAEGLRERGIRTFIGEGSFCAFCHVEGAKYYNTPEEVKHVDLDCPLSRLPGQAGAKIVEDARKHDGLLKKYGELLTERNSTCNMLNDRYFTMKDKAARLRLLVCVAIPYIKEYHTLHGSKTSAAWVENAKAEVSDTFTPLQAALRGEQKATTR